MMKDDEFLAIIAIGFPEKPIPAQFFWTEYEGSLDDDIPKELSNRIAQRCWKDVTLLDWRMVGVAPAISRSYLDPGTFLYYLPSLLVGALREVEYIDFALEAMIPYNKNHVSRGKWWGGFSKSVSPIQSATLSKFLFHVRFALWDRIGLADQALVSDAECIWPDTRGPLEIG